VAQGVGLVPHLSAAENVALGLEIHGRDRDEAAAAAPGWLAQLGLDHRAQERVDTLSAGERQRVAIARALAPAPALVVVDEPTSRLDEANARHVAALLGEAARAHGAAIVCATHEPLLIARPTGSSRWDERRTPRRWPIQR
jgi:ABC-type lipoprotein export system ATPase subunit